jgi:uncharacterized SAM-binding protein YcdF (DUF218 family)
MLHYLKQWTGLLGMPLVVAFLITAVAAAYRVRDRRAAARRLFLAAALLTYLASISLVGDALLGPLESRYAALSDERAPPQVSYVVVLGSDYRPRAGTSVTAALDADGLVRVVEAIRFTRRLGAARLVVSGGAPPGRAAPALGYAEFARRCGVPDAAVVSLSDSLDTHDEAHAVAKLLGSQTFILVTSSYHMPRAMWLMERAGAHPIPAPVGQRAWRMHGDMLGALIPGALGLSETEHALHEYLGLFAMSLGFD